MVAVLSYLKLLIISRGYLFSLVIEDISIYWWFNFKFIFNFRTYLETLVLNLIKPCRYQQILYGLSGNIFISVSVMN